jgi:hypothetical protein
MPFLPTKKDKGDGKLNSLFSMVSELQLLELLNSIVFLFMEPNIINSMKVIFLILKTTTKQTKQNLPLGDVAQEEMKFHYVVQCDF